MTTEQKTVPCPICKKPVPLDSEDVPFCSARCRTIDLGRWASGHYKISSPILDPEVLEGLESGSRPKTDEDDE
jgi:endogenous inhibitor of DNA gyrase (YacG/DUF329 family)